MRRHGLQWPWDKHQVGAWVLFGFLAAGVYIFYLPFVGSAATQLGLIVVYSLLVLVVLVLGYVTSAADPSDPALTDSSSDGEYYCTICQASVGPTSKHCRACDRCVQSFDHHCKWLNNCIGAANYRSFFILVATTLTMLTVQLGWGLYLISRSFYDSQHMMAMVADRYSALNYRGWQAVLFLYLLLLTGAIVMLGELFSFHCVLVSKNMTTFDYIMAQRLMQEGGEPTAPSGGEAAGARNLLCRSNRVADSATVVVPKKKAMKVSLNPCAACKTEKLEGNAHDWEAAVKAGKGAATVKFQMPPEPEKPAATGNKVRDGLSSSFSACTVAPDSNVPGLGVPTACTADAGAGLKGQGSKDPLSAACDSGVGISRRPTDAGATSRKVASIPQSPSLPPAETPELPTPALQQEHKQPESAGRATVPEVRQKEALGSGNGQGAAAEGGQAPAAVSAAVLARATPQRAKLEPLPLPVRSAAAVPASPTADGQVPHRDGSGTESTGRDFAPAS